VSTLVIHKELMRRLDQLARRTGPSPTALGNLLLEAAVTEEERLRARDQRVAKALEEVLVRAILRGEYDPAGSGTDARSGRSSPSGEALENPAAAVAPGEAGREG
jgi:predicted transcriptional regulator